MTQARSTNFPKNGDGSAGAGEDAKVLKDLSKQNAMLRRKLDDAL